MMNRIFALTVVGLGLLGLGAVDNLLSTSALPAAELRGVDMVEGIVMSAGNSRLMIIPDSGDMTEFAVAANARVTRDGEVTQLDGLHPKDHVAVMCTGQGQDRVAVDIVARSPR